MLKVHWGTNNAHSTYYILRFSFRSSNVNEPGNCVKNRKTDSNVYKIQLFVACWIYRSLMWTLNSFVWFWWRSVSLFSNFGRYRIVCSMQCLVLIFPSYRSFDTNSLFVFFLLFALLGTQNVCDSWLFSSRIIFSVIFHILAVKSIRNVSLTCHHWMVKMLSAVSCHVQTLNNNEKSECSFHNYFSVKSFH